MNEDEPDERATTEDYLDGKEKGGEEFSSKSQQKTSGTKVILVTYRDEFEKNEAAG